MRCVGGISVSRVIILASSCAALLAFQVTQAQADGLYVSLQGGATFPEKTESIFDPGLPSQGTIVSDADTGFRVGGALGYVFNKYFSVEGEFSYLKNDIDTLTASSIPGGPQPAVGSAHSYTGMANAYLSLPAGAWRPYVGAGIGRAHVTADNVGFAAIPTVTTNDSDSATAWQLMAGVGYQIAPNLELGARYRFLNINDITLRNSSGDIQAVDDERVHSVEAVLTWSWQREERVRLK